ncbi:hypothetical protein H0H81_003849, partial [Sphagnurus paluster]
TVIALVMGQAGIAFWGTLTDGDKALHSANIANFIDAVKNEIRKEPSIKIELPDNYEGDPAQISPWIRRMELYFLHKKLQDEVEMMTLTLQKIKKGKGNRAQEWANMHIKSVLQYQVELRDWKMANGDQEPTTAQRAAFANQPPFASCNAMGNELLRFFQTTETQSKAIKKLNSIRQGTCDFEDFWMEFKAAATASQFDNAAIVNAFKETINPGLGRKLVEMARLTISDLIQTWADRATEFERAKRDADRQYGQTSDRGKQEKPKQQSLTPTSHRTAGPSKPMPTLRDENAMDIDQKEGRCYKCHKKGHRFFECPNAQEKKKVFTNRQLEKLPEIDTEKMTDAELGSYYQGAHAFEGRQKLETPEWLLQCLRKDKTRAIGLLRTWTHKSKQDLCTEALIDDINDLSDCTAKSVLHGLKIQKWYLRRSHSRQLDVKLTATTLDMAKSYDLMALLDTGCTGSCISKEFVLKNKINTQVYPMPSQCFNADGSPNKSGSIMDYVEIRIRIKNHFKKIHLSVTDFGKNDIFLGFDWIQFHNPQINWQTEQIEFDRCPESCQMSGCRLEPEETEELWTSEVNYDLGEKLLFIDFNKEAELRQSTHIRAGQTTASKLAESHTQAKPKKSFEEIVPEEYHEFKEMVFGKE